ncbi:GrpB family protein [Cohnella sp. REN36]|uniref:GrpB family protein n=1 Tax=Cohnella sp. REN36 TaxID=2887347 RepID=UPI001D1570D1|nr:GrpB family protein [Cohnella sp. REN36]MCC3372448.1 GrpB family protein [Cohnella sp. REN36]
MLGLPRDEVFLVPWTEEWEAEFLLEKDRIETEIGELIRHVHHIGSTAVRDLSAKPIIDMAIELEDFQQGYACVRGLEKIAYVYKGINVLPDRHYFNKGEPRTHQIHMYPKGSPYLKRQLAFRDYLIQHEEARKEYQALKERLSRIHGKDKLTYADQKTDFVNSILGRMGFGIEPYEEA